MRNDVGLRSLVLSLVAIAALLIPVSPLMTFRDVRTTNAETPPSLSVHVVDQFGRVVEGMEIVKRILVMPKSQKADNPAMIGQMLEKYVPIQSVKRA